ncbi:HAD family hydrolase [Kordia jejudonensis]|uniref:HAD family hydrolase n=1 Tax=Kordia jejudonensis TaxID=1348245 RepID=UPI00069AB696|nr:HAD family hydrolase [Kordia jejudonensis]
MKKENLLVFDIDGTLLDSENIHQTGSLLKPVLFKLNAANIRFEEELLVTSTHYFTREEIVHASIVKAKNYFNVNHFKRVISLGDGVWDVKTANNLGLEFIGIGKDNREKLAAKGAKIHFTHFKEFELKLL